MLPMAFFILCFQDSRALGTGLLGILRQMVKVKRFPSLHFNQSPRLYPVTCIGIVFKISLTKRVELSAAKKRN